MDRPGCYPVSMRACRVKKPRFPTSLGVDISPGQMLLIVGPRTLRYYMTRLIITLAASRSVQVLDAGSQFEASLAGQLAGRRKKLLERIHVTPVSTCRRLFTQLENGLAQPGPLVVLDVLHPFYDTSILYSERKELLNGCLEQLRRIRKNGGAVSLCPPEMPLLCARRFFTQVEGKATGIFTTEITLPGRELRKLYSGRSRRDPKGLGDL